jgi:transforming growth factor-beta-induced protein
MRTTIVRTLQAIALGAALTACATQPAQPTIAEAAVSDGRFTTLVAALGAADLVGLFADPNAGPFTVFAPTDDAFAALPEGTVEALLADIPTLTAILTYHVVDGAITAEQVLGLISAAPGGTLAVETLNGEEISVTFDGTNVIINGDAKVIITDVLASNGVIHVIDTVLLPPSP